VIEEDYHDILHSPVLAALIIRPDLSNKRDNHAVYSRFIFSREQHDGKILLCLFIVK